eukprot:53095-Prorocentrum_minimum.AAC.1
MGAFRFGKVVFAIRLVVGVTGEVASTLFHSIGNPQLAPGAERAESRHVYEPGGARGHGGDERAEDSGAVGGAVGAVAGDSVAHSGGPLGGELVGRVQQRPQQQRAHPLPPRPGLRGGATAVDVR